MKDHELIKDKISKSGKTQREVAREVGVTRTTLNKYLNGHDYISDDIKKRIAEVIDSPILLKKFRGTTSSNVVFDIEYNNLYEILSKAEIELDELKEAIQEAKKGLVNSGHKCDMSRGQVKVSEYLLQQNEDVNQATDIIDMAFQKRGFCLDERNRKFKDRMLKKHDLITTREEVAYV